MRLRLFLTLGALAIPGTALAQSNGVDSMRSTRTGVYTPRQAAKGSELYALHCASCHTPASHTAPGFTAKWEGRPLAELLDYVRSSMPKSDPGSLTQREYLQVLAYLLKLNGIPAGAEELPADSLALQKIRIEWKATRDSSQLR